MSREPQSFGREDVDLLETATPYDGFWKLRVLRLRHRRFGGGWSDEMTREVHCRGEAVGVLLYDADLDAIGMVEQFRSGALMRGVGSPWLLELVAGLREPDEKPEEVAARETLEEAGCTVRELVPVAAYYSSPGGCDEYFHLYCARVDLSAAAELHGLPHEHEDIRLHVIPWEEALEWQARGLFDNAHSLLAMQWLALRRDSLRTAWRSG